MKKKIILYSLLYMVISIASAFGAIQISSFLQNNAGSSSETPPYQLVKIVDNITASERIDADINLNLSSPEANYNITIDANLDMSDSENTELGLDVNLVSNDSAVFDISVEYLDSVVYMQFGDQCLSFRAENFFQSIFGVVKPILAEVGFDLDALSLDDILIMLNNFEETKTKDNITLDIALPVVNVNLQLICDRLYNLIGINLPALTLSDNGMSIEVNGQINYPDEMIIEKGDSEYKDITNILTIASDILSRDQMAFDLNFDLAGQEFAGEVALDIENATLGAIINYQELQAKLLFKDNVIFAEIGNIYFKFDLNDLSKLNTFLQENFDITLPEELISTLLDFLQNKDIIKLLENIDFTKLDLSSIANISNIDLSFLDAIECNGSDTIINADFGTITLSLDGEKLSLVNIDTASFDLLLSDKNYTEISLSQNVEYYHDINLLLPTISSVLDIVNSNYLSGSVKLSAKQTDITFDYILSFKDEMYLSLTTTILGQDIALYLVDNVIYVELSQSKLSLSLDDISLLTEFISNVLGQEIDMSNMLGSILSILNPDKNPILITELIVEDNITKVNLFNGLNLVIENQTGSINLNASYNNYNITAIAKANDGDLTKQTIDPTEYTSLALLMPTIENAIEYINQGKIYIQLSAQYKDFVLDGVLSYEKENSALSASLTLYAYGEQIRLTIIDNIIYLSALDINVKFNIDDFDKLKQFLLDNFNIDLDSALNDINLGEIDLEKLLSSLNILITDSIIQVSTDELNLSVNIVDQMLDNITIQYQDINAQATILKDKPEIKVDGEYVDIVSLLPTIENIYNYIKNGAYYVEFNANVKDISLSGYLGYENSELVIDAKLSVLGINIDLKMIKNVIYLSYNDIKLKFNLEDFDDFRAFLEENFGLDLSQIDEILSKLNNLNDLTSSLGDLDIGEILKKLNIKLNQNNIEITYDNIFAVIDLSENNLQGVTINIDEILAKLTVLTAGREVTLEDKSKYVDIVTLLPLIENIKSLIDSKEIFFDISANYGDIALNGGINIIDGNISMSAVISAYGLNIDIAMLNEIVYLSYDNLKLKFALSDIDQLLSFLNENFGIDLGSKLDELQSAEFNLDKIIEIIKSESVQEILAKIKLSMTSENLIASYDELKIIIDFANSNLNFMQVNYKDLSASLSLANEQTIVSVNESDYIDAITLLPLVENVYNYINEGNFYLDFTVSYNNYRIDGALNIADGAISLALTTNLYGQKIDIALIDNIVYLDVNDIKGKFAIKDLDEVAYLLNDNFGIDLVNILEKISNLDLNNFNLNDIISIFEDENIELDFNIENILSELKLSLNSSALIASINAGLIKVNFTDDMINLIQVDYKNILASIEIANQPFVIEIVGENDYVDLANFLPSIENIYNYIQTQEIYLNFDLTYQQFDIKGGINFVNGVLSLNASMLYNDMSVNIALLDDVVYIDINDIKINLALSDLDQISQFVLNRFDYDIDAKLAEVLEKLKNVDIEELLSKISITLQENQINASINIDDNIANLSVTLENNMIKDAIITYQDLQAYITIASQPTPVNVQGQYVNAIDVIDSIDTIFDFVSTRQFDLDAQIFIGDDIIDGKVQFDFVDDLVLSAVLSSQTMENMDISANIENGMFYFNYNGLAIKIDSDHFNEILYIVLEVLGIDPALLPFLDDVSLDLDFGQLQDDFSGILGEITIDKVVEMINMIKGFGFKDGDIIISLSGESLFGNSNANNLEIKIITENDTISSIQVNNIYTDETLKQKVDLNIDFNTFSPIEPVDQSINYIDISGSNEIIKAIVNMSNDTQFHIKGSLDLVGTLAGIDLTWNVPFDLQFKILEDRSVEAYAVIGVIPVIVGVNADQYKPGDANQRNRMLYIYVKGDKIYMYRTEEVFYLGWREHRKGTSMTLDQFMKDPYYYIQLGTGFSDTIIQAIEDAINAERENPLNYGNIIKSFDTSTYELVLNMRELADSEVLDTLSLAMQVGKDSKGQNYLSGASLAMNMPLASIFQLYISSNDIQMVDYGKDVDTSAVQQYINSYTYEFGQSWEYRT